MICGIEAVKTGEGIINQLKETTVPNAFGNTVFDVEPFGHELKAEWLRLNEEYPVFVKS
jgi:hypothetical protein